MVQGGAHAGEVPVYVVSLLMDEARPDAGSSSRLQRQVMERPRVVEQR